MKGLQTAEQPKSSELEKLQIRLQDLKKARDEKDKKIADLERAIQEKHTLINALNKENRGLEKRIAGRKIHWERNEHINKTLATLEAEYKKLDEKFTEEQRRLANAAQEHEKKEQQLKIEHELSQALATKTTQPQTQEVQDPFMKLSTQLEEQLRNLEQSLLEKHQEIEELELKTKCLDSFPGEILSGLSALKSVDKIQQVSLVGGRIYIPILNFYGYNQFEVKTSSDFDIHCNVDDDFNPDDFLKNLTDTFGYQIIDSCFVDGVFNYKLRNNNQQIVDFSFYKPNVVNHDGWRFHLERFRISTYRKDGFIGWNFDVNNNVGEREEFDDLARDIWRYNPQATGFFLMYFEGRGISDNMDVSTIKELLPLMNKEFKTLCEQRKITYKENFDDFVNSNTNLKQDDIRTFYLKSIHTEYTKQLLQQSTVAIPGKAPEKRPKTKQDGQPAVTTSTTVVATSTNIAEH
jgi:hypothetical protein